MGSTSSETLPMYAGAPCTAASERATVASNQLNALPTAAPSHWASAIAIAPVVLASIHYAPCRAHRQHGVDSWTVHPGWIRRVIVRCLVR